jgi:signal recognition particle subunit SRP54
MPHLINGSRRLRIAAGSGQTIQDVNKLLTARKQMEKMMKQMGRGKMPGLPTQQQAPTSLSAGRKSGVKRKKKRARR